MNTCVLSLHSLLPPLIPHRIRHQHQQTETTEIDVMDRNFSIAKWLTLIPASCAVHGRMSRGKRASAASGMDLLHHWLISWLPLPRSLPVLLDMIFDHPPSSSCNCCSFFLMYSSRWHRRPDLVTGSRGQNPCSRRQPVSHSWTQTHSHKQSDESIVPFTFFSISLSSVTVHLFNQTFVEPDSATTVTSSLEQPPATRTSRVFAQVGRNSARQWNFLPSLPFNFSNERIFLRNLGILMTSEWKEQ